MEPEETAALGPNAMSSSHPSAGTTVSHTPPFQPGAVIRMDEAQEVTLSQAQVDQLACLMTGRPRMNNSNTENMHSADNKNTSDNSNTGDNFKTKDNMNTKCSPWLTTEDNPSKLENPNPNDNSKTDDHSNTEDKQNIGDNVNIHVDDSLNTGGIINTDDSSNTVDNHNTDVKSDTEGNPNVHTQDGPNIQNNRQTDDIPSTEDNSGTANNFQTEDNPSIEDNQWNEDNPGTWNKPNTEDNPYTEGNPKANCNHHADDESNAEYNQSTKESPHTKDKSNTGNIPSKVDNTNTSNNPSRGGNQNVDGKSNTDIHPKTQETLLVVEKFFTGEIWLLRDTQWERLVVVPEERLYHNICSCGVSDGIVMFGGFVRAARFALYCYHFSVVTKQWKRLSDSPVPLANASAVQFDDMRVLVVGGENDEKDALRTSMALDVRHGTWSSAGSLPWPMSKPLVAAVLGYVLIIPQTSALFASCQAWVYDPSSNIYSSLTPLPDNVSMTRGACLLGVNSKVYLLGGAARLALEYNPLYEQWVRLKKPNLRYDKSRGYGVGVEKSGNILFCGGSTEGGKEQNMIEEYNHSTKEWKTLDICLPFHWSHVTNVIL